MQAHGGGVLFSLLRNLFGWYVSAFPTYQNVYGELSVVPTFLIWRYMSWGVVLLGAFISLATGFKPVEGNRTVAWRVRGG